MGRGANRAKTVAAAKGCNKKVLEEFNMTKAECKEFQEIQKAGEGGPTVLDDLEEKGTNDCPRPGPGGTEDPTAEEIKWDEENRQYLKLPKCKKFMAGTIDSAKFSKVHTSGHGAMWIHPGKDKNDQPTPAPVKRKRRKPEAIKHIVIHEPIAFDREATHRSLNAKCLGVHYTIDRDGSIQQHADPREITVHAGFMNNESISIEMISRIYMFTGKATKTAPIEPGNKAKWLVSKNLPLVTIPDGNEYRPDGSMIPGPYNQEVLDRKMAAPWLTRRASGRGGNRYTKRRNFILPTEDQVIALYKLVDFLIGKYPNLKLNFPGVNICHALFGGYRWKNTSAYVRIKEFKKMLSPSDFGWPTAEDYLAEGGITAHARTANHSDGLFYEHYLYSRYLYRAAFKHDVRRDRTLRTGTGAAARAKNLGINHKIAWEQTLKAIWLVSLPQNKDEDKVSAKRAAPGRDGLVINTEGIAVHGHNLQAGDIRDTGAYFGFHDTLHGGNAPQVTNLHRSKEAFKEACKLAGHGSPCNVSTLTNGPRTWHPNEPGRAEDSTGIIQP